MAFNKKKDSISLSEAQATLKDPRALRGMSKKEVQDLRDLANGKGSILKDLRADRVDRQEGRGGRSGGVGSPPPPRTGRSMWGKGQNGHD